MNLVFIYGAPAAGKLTVAQELARQTGYKLLDNHRLTDYLPEMFPRSEPRFEKLRSQLGRKMRLDLFQAAAQADVSLITTFAPISEGMHDFVRAVIQSVEDNGGNVCLVHLNPSRDVLLARVLEESRKGKKIETVERWHEVLDDNPGAFETFPGREHLVLDNSNLSPSRTAELISNTYHLQQITV